MIIINQDNQDYATWSQSWFHFQFFFRSNYLRMLVAWLETITQNLKYMLTFEILILRIVMLVFWSRPIQFKFIFDFNCIPEWEFLEPWLQCGSISEFGASSQIRSTVRSLRGFERKILWKENNYVNKTFQE